LLLCELKQAGALEVRKRGEERDLNDAGMSPDFDCTSDRCAVSYLADGHTKEASCTVKPIVGCPIQIWAGTDDRNRRALLNGGQPPLACQRDRSLAIHR